MKRTKHQLAESWIMYEGLSYQLDDEGKVHVTETEAFAKYRQDYVRKAKVWRNRLFAAGAALIVMGAVVAFAFSGLHPGEHEMVMPVVAGIVFAGVAAGAIGVMRVHLAENFRDNILRSAEEVCELNLERRDEIHSIKTVTEDGRVIFYNPDEFEIVKEKGEAALEGAK